MTNVALPLCFPSFDNVAYAQTPDDDDFDDDDFDDEFEDDDDFEDQLNLSDGELESLLSVDDIDALDGFDTFTDSIGNFALSGEILLYLPTRDLEALTQRGYKVRSQEYLAGVNKNLVKIEPPVSANVEDVKRDIKAIMPGSEIDYNHIFQTESGKRRVRKAGRLPAKVISPIKIKTQTPIKIGMIDTAISRSHAVFSKATITEKDFVSFDFKKPTHGTSVASILVGESDSYRGLLPEAELYAASVFFNAPFGSESATTESLIQAINWLVEQDVNVINMSLAGPSNEILEQTINDAYRKGVIIIAAVGNSGPSAKPLFPAAYDRVVAVTAIDEDNTIYRRANRGDHVDFSAPGVKIQNARGKKKYQTSTGTSYATPFVAAIFASHGHKTSAGQSQLLNEYRRTATDLGENGYDPIYGYGLISP